MSVRDHDGKRVSEQTSPDPTARQSSPDDRPSWLRVWQVRLRTARSLDALLFGVVAFGIGLYAQGLLTSSSGMPNLTIDTTAPTRWYVLAVAFLLIGWSDSYANESLLSPLLNATIHRRGWAAVVDRRRTTMVGSAIFLNLVGVVILLTNWSSWWGSALWLISIVLLVYAYRHREPNPSTRPLRTWHRRRVVEMVVLAVILLLALGLRLWQLGDLTPGMHGDEGEAGTQALSILNGNPVSPWTRGWFSQSNVYYWTLAVFMKILGTGLFGLRSFAVVCGLVTVLFVYLLARDMFGLRAGIIAGFLISFQSADLLFSRQEFSNVTVPPLQAATFYFILRGLRTRRYLDWVFAGLCSGLALYYFAGGRIIGPVALLFLGYLAVVHREVLRAYWTRVLALVIALIAIATPFLAYYLAYPLPTNTYPNDRFIWLHHADLTAQFGTSNWGAILWAQLTLTLSVITHGIDLSAMSVLDYPIARPLEATLIVLGLAWSAWRWRDARFAMLSIWFWTAIIAGGVLTIGQPNLPRILGILPVLALLIAAVLDHFIILMGRALDGVRGSGTLIGKTAGSILAAGVVVVSGVQNKQMYFDHFLHEHTNTTVTAQAAYVHKWGPGYYYYELATPMLYWTHGDNRFINPDARGEDMANPPNSLPIVDDGVDGNLPVKFMVWQPMYDYLPVLQAYYPGGTTRVIHVGDPSHLTDPLITYTVNRKEIDAHRTLLARYQPASGATVSRREGHIGIPAGISPPAHLHYPMNATWSGALVAPQYDTYQFRLQAPAGSRLTIDGVRMFPAPTAGGDIPVTVIMAQGVHTISLSTRLTHPKQAVSLEWASHLNPMQPIPRKYLWDDHVGRSWNAIVRPVTATLGGPPLALGSASQRIDGFVGFRSTGIAFGPTSGLEARWTSRLHIRHGGDYEFQLNSLEGSDLLIDQRKVVVDQAVGSAANIAGGQVYLRPGSHSVTLDYRWSGLVGYLELWWKPPGKPLQLMMGPQLTPVTSGASRTRTPLGPITAYPPPASQPPLSQLGSQPAETRPVGTPPPLPTATSGTRPAGTPLPASAIGTGL